MKGLVKYLQATNRSTRQFLWSRQVSTFCAMTTHLDMPRACTTFQDEPARMIFQNFCHPLNADDPFSTLKTPIYAGEASEVIRDGMTLNACGNHPLTSLLKATTQYVKIINEACSPITPCHGTQRSHRHHKESS
jgi:hypothetical protein